MESYNDRFKEELENDATNEKRTTDLKVDLDYKTECKKLRSKITSLKEKNGELVKIVKSLSKLIKED